MKEELNLCTQAGYSVPDPGKIVWYHLCGHDAASVTTIGNHFGFHAQDVDAANNPALCGPQVT